MKEHARLLRVAVACYTNADDEPVITLQQTPDEDAIKDIWECRESADYFWTLARAFGHITAPIYLDIPADTEDWQDVLDFLEEYHDDVACGPFYCTIAAAAGVISIYNAAGTLVYEQ